MGKKSKIDVTAFEKQLKAVAEQAIKEISNKLQMNQMLDTYEAIKNTNS